MPTNLLLDPTFATDVATPGLADDWTIWKTTVTAPTMTLVAGGQRMVYAGEVTNNGTQEVSVNQDGDNGTFAPGESASFYCYLSGSITGGQCQLEIDAFDASDAYISKVVLVVTLTATPTLYSISFANLPALTDYVEAAVTAISLTSAAAVDITAGNAVLLKGNVVYVTGDIGPAAAGATVTFTPNGFSQGATYVDQIGLLQVTSTAVAPVTDPVICDSDGSFNAVLFATDNSEFVSGPLPASWTWSLTVNAPEVSPPVGLTTGMFLYAANNFRADFANGATQDLSAILPASISPVGFPATLAAETTAREAADLLRAPLDTGSATTAYILHTDSGWSYSGVPGAWVANQPEVGSYTGTNALAVANGATAGLTFTGTAITIIGHTGPDHGGFTAQLDSGSVDPWTAYSAGSVQQATIVTYSGLPYASHNIVIERTGGAYVEIDAAIITSGPSVGIEFTGAGGVKVGGPLAAEGGLTVVGTTYVSNTYVYGELALSALAGSTLIASAATIYTVGLSANAVHGAGALTGLILQPQTKDGAVITVINSGAYSITFDVDTVSNVADGVSDVIPALSARMFVWNGTASLWYAMI